MDATGIRNGEPGSSMTSNGHKGSSSSVDWLGKDMLELRLGDRSDREDDRVSFFRFFLPQHELFFKSPNFDCLIVVYFFAFCFSEHFVQGYRLFMIVILCFL